MLSCQEEKRLTKTESYQYNALSSVCCSLKSSSSLDVLNHIVSYVIEYGQAYPSQETIGLAVGVSRQTVNGIVDTLREVGLLRWHRRYNQSNVYRLPAFFSSEKIRKFLVKWIPALAGLIPADLTLSNSSLKTLPLSHDNVLILSLCNLNSDERERECVSERVHSIKDLKIQKKILQSKDTFSAECSLPDDSRQSHHKKHILIEEKMFNHAKQPYNSEDYPDLQPSKLAFSSKSPTMSLLEQQLKHEPLIPSPIAQQPTQDDPDMSRGLRFQQIERERSEYKPTMQQDSFISTPVYKTREDYLDRRTREDRELESKKLLEAYDSPGTVWLRRFIGEEDTHKLMSRVLVNHLDW